MGLVSLSAAFCACLVILVQSQQCTKPSDFSRHLGYQLYGHVMAKMTKPDVWSCVRGCVETPGCLSINVYNAGGLVLCELNKNNLHGSPGNLIPSSLDGEYIEIVSNGWPDACFQKGGWYRNLTFAYKFVNESLTNQQARQRCKELSVGADLMSIRDKEEEQVIDDYLKDFSSVQYVWLGLNDIEKEGTFVWFDGTKSNYTHWTKGEPNNKYDMEDCVEKNYLNYLQYFNGAWNDKNCMTNETFVCKVFCL